MGKTTVRRNYKDSLFRMVFREKKELLSLYNAINGTSYDNPEDLIITTLEDVLYMGLKNDVSFLIENVMNLYEGQSSWNPNMPLRNLFYASSLYQGYLKEQHLDIYSGTRLKLPTPKFVVFYNGTRSEPDRQELLLSDSFIKTEEPPSLECRVLVLNINYGQNKELMEACKKLHDYSYFVAKVREYLSQGLMLDEAVDQAVCHCIEKDILREFLEVHRTEVSEVILTEYDEELHLKTLYAEGKAEGEARGEVMGQRRAFRQSLFRYIRRNWQLPETLRQLIEKEENPETLQEWLYMAWESESVEELEEKIEKSVSGLGNEVK